MKKSKEELQSVCHDFTSLNHKWSSGCKSDVNFGGMLSDFSNVFMLKVATIDGKINYLRSIEAEMKEWFGFSKEQDNGKLEDILATLLELNRRHTERVDRQIKIRMRKLKFKRAFQMEEADKMISRGASKRSPAGTNPSPLTTPRGSVHLAHGQRPTSSMSSCNGAANQR